MTYENTLEDYGITKTVTLLCRSNLIGGGGFGLNTIDVSKNNTKLIEFDYNAPFYRTVGIGLSIQSICGNEREAKDKIVYCHIGCVRNYDILNHLSDIKCPACDNEVYPKIWGFKM